MVGDFCLRLAAGSKSWGYNPVSDFIKRQCQHCGGNIEFDRAEFGLLFANTDNGLVYMKMIHQVVTHTFHQMNIASFQTNYFTDSWDVRMRPGQFGVGRFFEDFDSKLFDRHKNDSLLTPAVD